MNMIRTMVLIAGLALLTGSAWGIDISDESRVVCGLFEVQECVAERGCEPVRPHEVNLRTRFLTVDFKKREIRAKDTERVTQADHLYEVGDKLFMAGAESGVAVEEHGVGYSLTITRTNGHMVLSVSGDDVAFVVFGHCTGA